MICFAIAASLVTYAITLNGWGGVCTAAFVLSLSASALAQSSVITAETMVVCAAKAGERQTWAADTSGGV